MRDEQILQRLKYFLKDLSASIKPLDTTEDKIYFIKTLMELNIEMPYKNNEYFGSQNFDEENFIDEQLLAKFRHKMKVFVSCKLHYYFSPDTTYQESLNQRLQINPAVILDKDEFFELTERLYQILDMVKTDLYLKEPNKPDLVNDTSKLQELAEQKTGKTMKGSSKSTRNEFTRSRQTIAMNYLFQSVGLKVRGEISVVSLARLAHLLSAMPYEDANDTSIGKMMKKLPDMTQNKHYEKDLEFVRKHFVDVQLKEAVELIDKELALLEKKLKFKKN
jgi:hypothetical protein